MIQKTLFILAATASLSLVPHAHASGFPVTRFVIEGNTLVGTDRLLPPLSGLLGEARSLDDLLEAKTRVEATYREAGYSLVSVGLPRSIQADGTVRLQVRELLLNAVAVIPAEADGDRHRNALPSLREGASPNLLQLTRELNLANDNPSRAMIVGFVQIEQGIGAEIKVQESPSLRMALTLDSTGTDNTGRYRAGVVVQHCNVLDLDHQMSVALATSPGHIHDVAIASMSYQIPLPALGDSLLFVGNYSDVDSGQLVDFFKAAGKGHGYGVHYVHNLTGSAGNRASANVGIDRQIYRDIVTFSGLDIGTRVSTRPLSILFSATGQAERHSYAATLSAARNLPGGSKNDDDAYAKVRFGAQADWSVARASLRWSLLLAGNSQLSLRGEMQHSETPLIPGEQYGLGGIRSVRGLDEREVAGDRGWLGSIEWTSPPLFEYHRLAFFSDAGRVHRVKSPGSSNEAASNWGLGWRFGGWKGLSISLDVARILDGAGVTDKGETHGSLSAVWWL